MKSPSPGFWGLACWLVVSACAGASQSGGSAQGPPTRNRNLITAQEIDPASGTNAYDLVQQLRPNWLSRPPTASISRGFAPVLVYIDGRQAGGLEELRQIAREHIEKIEWLSAQEATTKYGTGHASGAIEVTTRRG